MRTNTIAAFLALTTLACQSDSADPPFEPVPLSRGTQPAAHDHGEMPAGRAQPLPPGADNALPPDHPPLPGNQAAALPPDHPPLPGNQGGLPADHPPIPNAQNGSPMATPPLAAAAGAGSLAWTAPPGWVEEPPATNMRLVQWRLGSGGGGAECYMSRFAGSGGSVDDNVSRWIGQFTQPDGVPSNERAVRGTTTVNGLQVSTLSITGTFQSRNPPMSGPIVDMPGFAMYGAIIETPEGPYFLKCTGPESTLTAERAAIEGLVASFAAH